MSEYKSPSSLYKLARSGEGEKLFLKRQATINQEKERKRKLDLELAIMADNLINEEIDRLVKSMEKQQIIMENLQKGVNSMINILTSSKKTLAKSKSILKKSISSKKTLAKSKSSSDIIKYYLN